MPNTVRHDAICPICGAARTGAFRFCLRCGFDFDTSEGFGRAALPLRIGLGAAGHRGDRSWRGVVVGDGAFELSRRAARALIVVVAGLASLLVLLLSR